MMAIEEKLIEVLERAGWQATSLPCPLCKQYASGMYVNVRCAGFDYEHKKDTDKVTEKFTTCLINPVMDHQNLKDLFQVILRNKEEIFGSDYDFTWEAGRCEYDDTDFRVLITYEKEI